MWGLDGIHDGEGQCAVIVDEAHGGAFGGGVDGGAPPAGCVGGVWPAGSICAVSGRGDNGEVAGILLLVGGDGGAHGVNDGVCFGFKVVKEGADTHGYGFTSGFPGSRAAVIDACCFGDVVGGVAEGFAAGFELGGGDAQGVVASDADDDILGRDGAVE